MIRAYRVRDFKLTDHQRMPFVPISASTKPYHFVEGSTNNEYASLKKYLDSNLANSLTAAFLVIRNDSIIYENYFNGFNQKSLLPSFSVAKSFVSTLVGFAIDEGKIKSAQDPVTDYLPELLKTDPRYSKITLQHLLDMRSGVKFDEGSYGLGDDAIRLGFRPNILKHVLKVKVEKEPGGAFDYQSVNTELLALVVERATGKKISSYLQEKIWQPLGAENSATWNVDSKKHKQEIAFAGLNATARDFAKLGQLYLNGGKWNDRQLLSKQWTDAVTNPEQFKKSLGYKNQWWQSISFYKTTDSLEAVAFRLKHPWSTNIKREAENYVVGYNPAPHANGILNQYIYVFPERNVVIVRLGRNWSHPEKYATAFIYDIGNKL
jgi:CubicO group peptidase (beta-lactamase class C family)